MTRMELYEAIRRDHEIHGKSIRRIAEERAVHRRDVRRAIAGERPPKRRVPQRQRPVLGDLTKTIDQWLADDQAAPRKQRHTARRIWARLVADHGFTGCESTVRSYVAQRRRELIQVGTEVFIEQEYQPGRDAQVDFGVADVILGGRQQTVSLLFVRCCFSGRAEVIASRQQTQQCLLEGLAVALERFGGVFERLWFDNLTPAVKRVLRGRRRDETDQFVAFRSHYLFEAMFCRPGIEGAHEKGGVEGEVGRFRRNHLVPLPSMDNLDALNTYLQKACLEDESRQRVGIDATVGEMWDQSQRQLRPCPKEPFDLTQLRWGQVDSKSRVSVLQNFYSVPTGLVGAAVEANITATHVVFKHRGKTVARHERLVGTHQQSLQLDHYLEWFERKPAAMPGAKVVGQSRRRGEIPPVYDRLWATLNNKHGQSSGTREFVRVLTLLREHSEADVTMAVELAISYAAYGQGAVENLLRQLTTKTPEESAPLVDIGSLAVYNRPLPSVTSYDRWLGREVH